MKLCKRQRVVVVGNGPVGYELLAQLVPERSRDDMDLIVLGEEPVPAYDRVHLSDCFEGRTSEELSLAPRAWYADRRIRLITGSRVVAIEPQRRVVVAGDGWSTDYDRLVLATGASSRVPDVPGVDAQRVFTYRTLADLDAIRLSARGAKRAAVVGGGLLGLEAAHALQTLGLETTVLERSDRLMSRQLDAGSGAVLQRMVEQLGVQVRTGCSVAALRTLGTGRGHALAVELDPDEALSVDLVVIAAGIEPRDELARAAGLEVAETGGIIVDDRLSTSDPKILAIGDCARHRGIVYGLAAPGLAMAAVAAARLRGDTSARFYGSDTSCRLKLLGIDVAALGERPADAHRVSATGDAWHRVLLLSDERLVGACAVGRWGNLWRIDAAIAEGARVDAAARARFRATGELWSGQVELPVVSWPREAVVCTCARVTRGELSAKHAAGCRTVEDLGRATGAATTCGACRHLVAELCGQRQRPRPQAGSRGLILLSAVAAASAALFVGAGPLPDELVARLRLPAVDTWASSEARQLTGFALLALASLTLVLPLRKRLRSLRCGAFGWFRVLHAGVGIGCIALAAAHTGMRLGAGLNRATVLVFLGVIVSGALLGVVVGAETAGEPRLARVARAFRPITSWLHWLLLWILPVLIGFHVLAVYYF